MTMHGIKNAGSKVADQEPGKRGSIILRLHDWRLDFHEGEQGGESLQSILRDHAEQIRQADREARERLRAAASKAQDEINGEWMAEPGGIALLQAVTEYLERYNQ